MSKASSTPIVPALVASAVVVVSSVIWRRWRKSEARVMVSEINVYPIKSCAGVTMDCAVPTARGFEGDRILQVTQNGKYCTPREEDKAKLFHVLAVLWGDCLTLKAPNMKETLEINLITAETKAAKVEVLEAPDKLTLHDYGDEAAVWLEKATDIPKCRLMGIGPEFNRSSRVNSSQGDALPTKDGTAPMSLADEAPYLLTNQASLDDLNKRLKARGKDPVDMGRFRPNIVVQGLKPWQEDCLKKIRIRNIEFHVWQRCGRCIMTTVDRETLKRGPEPLATLSTFREREHGQRNFGMHLIPVLPILEEGTITVDDEVEILEYDQDRLAEWTLLFG